MNLYRVSPCLPFLEILADFILDNFRNKDAINNLKVILPNGIACSNLQAILVKKQTLAILPKVIPLSNIIADGEEIFKIPAENLSEISLLQEKIILTEIIYHYPQLKFSTAQALQFGSIVAELFYELACHHLTIEDVNVIEQKNLSPHWDAIYQFLQYTYHAWQKKLISLRKQDRIKWQITMLEAEISRLKDPNCSLIVAGIVGADQVLWRFLKEVVSVSRGFVILPPIDNIPNNLFTKPTIAEDDGLYTFKKLLGFLDCNLSDCQLLRSDPSYNTVFNKLITACNQEELNDQNVQYPTSIKYIALEDIFEEAEQIALLCRQSINKKIAIIVDNPLIKSFYSNFLTKYSLEFHDLIGTNLSQTLISSLIISISEILCNDFDLKKLFLLLKNPLINSRLVQELELLIKGKNRFILSTSQLQALIDSSNNNELIKWGSKLIKLLYQATNSNFIKILKSSVKIAETLYRDIWYEATALPLANFLSELIRNNCNLILEDKKYFPELLNILMKSYKYFESHPSTPNIIIGKVEDLILLKFDLVILADFNQGSWSGDSSINQWINEQTLQKLQMTPTKAKTAIYQYFFYLFLHNPEVIITRAKRQNGKSGILPSNLLLKLEFFLGDKLIRQSPIIADNISSQDNITSLNILNGFQELEMKKQLLKAEEYTHDYIYSPIFPDTLSATNIEMLIRNPYSFYAKMILKLRPKEIIGQDPKISEFGIFIHKILEQYSRNYDESISDHLQFILEISYDILQNTTLPSYTKKIWQTKFMPIAKSFIEFDAERRKHFKYIYPECRGEIDLTIGDKKLKIMAVADRIEVNEQRRAVIIDYKTGTLPSKKDVESGLSPQLIIEALILLEGGFGIYSHDPQNWNVKQGVGARSRDILHEHANTLKFCGANSGEQKSIQVVEVQQIIYVKFSSSPPYIQTVEIDISNEALAAHHHGMRHLLEYYVINKHFSLGIDLLTYNDYTHLARTIKKL
ncbi:PD-(D/E)XK nuclease family protein [Candidatus Tisiphia endosymbiont of Nemotelus uliginosus]|uniref:PD-(D/E)XK nuclease family protein n=1 Tax=Candidatus Tisiphia endosymbiont of Nemotelus uliginosus TaxID=3077926 RepID=UPI0035C8D00E